MVLFCSFRSPFSTPSLSPFSESGSPSFQFSNQQQQQPACSYSYNYKPWSNGENSPPNQVLVSPIANSISNAGWPNRSVSQQVPIASKWPSCTGQTKTTSPQESTKPSKSLPKRSEQIDISDFLRTAEIKKASGARPKMCTFCRTNNESPEVYTSHCLKDANDRITCPILMRYSCPECGATGEKTHTRRYCPVLQRKLRTEILGRMVADSNRENAGANRI